MFLLKNQKISNIPAFFSKQHIHIKYFSTSFNKEYYKILGISNNASPKEIKEGFYKLAKVFHPDVSKGSEDKFKEINEAYEILSDENKKRTYDSTLKNSQNTSYNNSASSNKSSTNQNYQSSYNSRYGTGFEKRRKTQHFYQNYDQYNPNRQHGNADRDSFFSQFDSEFQEHLRRDPEFRERMYAEYRQQQEV